MSTVEVHGNDVLQVDGIVHYHQLTVVHLLGQQHHVAHQGHPEVSGDSRAAEVL